ncbi:MAG: hypothetical protein BWX86_02854 [Verrucomicrobia bacterium ADurb.Bin122]|nr:MAG: hypothetical protein BWX86_02854 [Verrucomicrobia bacterium ADurb.Bin122]
MAVTICVIVRTTAFSVFTSCGCSLPFFESNAPAISPTTSTTLASNSQSLAFRLRGGFVEESVEGVDVVIR